MEFHATGSLLHPYSVSVPPPPSTDDKSPAVQKIGIQQELRCFGGGKRLVSEVQEDDGAVMKVGSAEVEEMQETTTKSEKALEEEEGGRERLKRHRREMGGRVWIPEIWGQEELLKDWIDCSAFDASLFPTGIGSARAALIEEGRRANNGGFRLENRC